MGLDRCLVGLRALPLFARESNAIIPFAAVVLGLLLYTLFHPGRPGERRRQTRSAQKASRRGTIAEIRGSANGSKIAAGESEIKVGELGNRPQRTGTGLQPALPVEAPRWVDDGTGP